MPPTYLPACLPTYLPTYLQKMSSLKSIAIALLSFIFLVHQLFFVNPDTDWASRNFLILSPLLLKTSWRGNTLYIFGPPLQYRFPEKRLSCPRLRSDVGRSHIVDHSGDLGWCYSWRSLGMFRAYFLVVILPQFGVLCLIPRMISAAYGIPPHFCCPTSTWFFGGLPLLSWVVPGQWWYL